ncbi:carbohydrate porin [Komagataeibacter intermedius]|nr:carbohydrate porin [Komagataeibacter intermedius]GAN87061.1 porin B carbohydrate-selective OprB [Komagataeibacter intermedius TF2]GBQ71735.1 carbohydrate-selective porin OprB [Komagataeibacter intermedius NRIC 0521]
MSHVAWGQTEDEQEVPQYTAEKEPEVSPVVSFSRYIGLQGITHNLANRGIYFNGYYAGTSYSQASGGRKKGTAFLHDFAYGMDLDLEKLVHLHGGQIHIGLDSRFGTFNAGGLNTFNGSAMDYQGGVTGPSNNTRLSEFSYEQNLFNRIINIRLGRIAPTKYLTNLPTDCQFVSFVCGNPGGWSFNANQSHWPVATWGGMLTIRPATNYYIQTGAYADNSWGFTRTGFPFSGNWSEAHANGTFIPVEGGYSSTYETEAYPKKYVVGFYYDSHNFSDAYLNTAGKPLLTNGGTPMNDGAHTEVYGEFMQTVWKPNRKSHEDLQIFGGAYIGSSGHPTVNAYYTLGVLKHGLPRRPHDYMGLIGVASVFNQRVTAALDTAVQVNGGRGNFARSTEGVEFTYGAEVLPGVLFRPYIDAVFHPDQELYAYVPDPKIHYSVGGGAQIMIRFNEAFDLPEIKPL